MNKLLKNLLLILSFGCLQNGYSQMVGDDAVFLQGCFIEIGISSCGVYGSAEPPPAGPYDSYHGIDFNGLGFIADHEKDGWDESSGGSVPVFCGDYFSPGSPEEGWVIQYGSDVYENHYIGCYGYGSATTPDIDGEILSYTDAAGIKQAVWQGTLEEDDLNITLTQTTTFPNGALFFLTGIEVCNNGDEDLVDFYYMRNVDPDQDVDHCGNYSTTNTIVYNPPDDDTALVSAIGGTCECYLGIGAIDPRARVSWGNFSVSPYTPEEAWNGDTGAGYYGTGSTYCDCAVQISFKIDIPAGECETIYFAHILDPSDLEEALEATLTGGVGITANGVSITETGEYGVCNPGDTVIIEINGDTTITWSISPDLYLDTDTGSYIIATPLETTTYTIIGEGGECGDVSTEFTLVVDNEEVADAGADEEICFGSSVPLSGSGGEEYLWEPADGLSDPEVSNPTASPEETTIYQLTTFDEYGCPAYDEMTVTVWPLPDVETGEDGSFCIDGTFQLEASGAETYSWSPTEGLDNPESATPITTIDEATTYTVTGTDEHGCQNTAEQSVTVDLLPEVIATADPYSIDTYQGETTQLNVETGGVSFLWTPADGLSSTTIENPIANPSDTTIYVVTVTDANGCVSSDTVIVKAMGEITIDLPNAYSPNGDGINDYYYPIVQGSGEIVNYLIYNRWGEVVYEGSASSSGWDGIFNGKTSDVGSYVVIVNALTSLGEKRFVTGSFLLIR